MVRNRLAHFHVSPSQLADYWQEEPWPDRVTESFVKLAENPDAASKELSNQVALRVRRGRSVPPLLQAWYNRYTAGGGRVSQAPPSRKERDRIEVATFQALFGMSRAKAIRRVAQITHRDAKSVESNLYR